MAEMADVKTQPFYLKKAKLKGYKSIKNAEIEFCEGLNIVIGKNASGKSNLLEFLFSLMSFKDAYNSSVTGNLTLSGIKDLEIKTTFPAENEFRDSFRLQNQNIKQEFFYDKKNIGNPFFSKEVVKYSFLRAKFIRFNIPNTNDSPIIDHPLRIEFHLVFQSDEFKNIFKKQSYKLIIFIVGTIHSVLFGKSFELRHDFDKLNLDLLKNEAIKKINREIERLNTLFEGLLPLEAIRLNPNFNLHFNKEQQKFTLDNLYIEYKINGNWVLYPHLSDGTKRLFYIISELYFGHIKNTRSPFDPEFLQHEEIEKNIFLLEEPELGIHPHQLHKLMTFIKEQSRDKQIILSTHSPMVLDVLGKGELHRIIIASNDNPKKGSQFRHLTKEEEDKARLYMDGDFLSDYWKHSDLEG